MFKLLIISVLSNKKYKGKRAVDYFSSGFFLDCQKDKILIDQDYDIVIERVLSRSYCLEKELLILDDMYPRELIIELAIEKSGQIFGNEQIEEISKHYNLDPKKFRRYFIK